MTATFISLFFLFAIGIVWITWRFLRKPARIPQLMPQVDTSLTDQIFPFIDSQNPELGRDGDMLFDAIGGLDGIRRMDQEAQRYKSAAMQLEKEHPEFKGEAAAVQDLAISLRTHTYLAQIEEAWRRSRPSLPRVESWACAMLYCEMVATLEVVSQNRQPTVPVRI